MNSTSPMVADEGDWTQGQRQIRYQVCEDCGTVWYFSRTFCPACGRSSPMTKVASGRGVVYAATVVLRAPSAELAQYTPYGVLLVDAMEGFRMMAHGDTTLAIGDVVVAQFRIFGRGLIPYFVKSNLEANNG